MIHVLHVSSPWDKLPDGKMTTRIQLGHADLVAPLSFYLRSRGHQVRYYRLTDPLTIGMPETARVVCLMREYGMSRRKVK